MAINPLWLVHKFDYVGQKLLYQNNPISGLKEPVYWDEDDVDAFVDSDLGNDTTGDGTAALPWKTLGKVKASGASYWAAGKVIMCRGYFTEILAINVAVKIIGAGGLLGKAWLTVTLGGGSNNAEFDNLLLMPSSISTTYSTSGSEVTLKTYSVIFLNSIIRIRGAFISYDYYTIYINPNYGSNYQIQYHNQYGNNNTIYGAYRGGSATIGIRIYGNNNHSNNLFATIMAGSNNIINTNGAYLNPTNFNFNFINTSPLYRTGTYNPDIDNYNHVGAGTLGANLNASSDCLNDDVDATYTNLDKSGTEIFRPDVADDGILESGIYDFGQLVTRVIMNMNYTYEHADGTIYRRIQETEGRTVTQIFDCIIQYGETLADVADCPELLIEYGKIITVSGTGVDRKGNADPDFDPADMIPIDNLLIKYLKITKLKFRGLA